MTVWVLIAGGYDEYVVGVFSTAEKAMAAWPDCDWGEEPDGTWFGSSREYGKSASLQPHTLDYPNDET